ncbi:hypothetical protein F5Y15DRAFT_388380 [Xylariaceae sp. FL0016]|nr:hypothetical protein F5Y15DRAFT_388380 [Xylariaceae sp. FL0016]
MAPIPVYTDSPITTAAKPDGVTPKTATSTGPSSIQVTAPPTAAHQSTYPAPMPGAAPAVPTPTTAAQVYAPAHPSITAMPGSGNPPPPQPGAVPTSTTSNIPPPPKVGEKYEPPQQTPAPQPVSMPYPQQMSIPPPTASLPSQQQGTATAAAPSSLFGTQIPTGADGQVAQSLQHPPGYHQNANASELDRYQRSAIQQSEYEGTAHDSDTEGVWGAAKKWAQQTGEKLAAAENEVWKKINKD